VVFPVDSFMKVVERALPILGSLTVLALLGFVVRWPGQWAIWLLVVIIANILTGVFIINLQQLIQASDDSAASDVTPHPRWWRLLLAPTLLSVVAVGLLLFVETNFGRQLLILLTAGLACLFWESMRRHHRAGDRYHLDQLASASLLVHVAVVWLAAAGFFRLLLDPMILPPNLAVNAFTITTILMLLLVWFLDYRAIWLMRYPADRVWPFVIVEAIIVGEIFWVLNFLPSSPDVKAFLVGLCYYALATLGRAHFDDTLRLAVVRRYLYFIIITLIAVLVTARWLV
jgi:hypothetical protein